MQVAPDRRERLPGLAGYLLIRQPVEQTQGDHVALPLGKRSNGPVQGDLALTLQHGLGGSGVPVRRAELESGIQREGRLRPGDGVERAAGDDLAQPGAERGAFLELAQVLPGSEERLLNHVLRVQRVLDNTQRHAVREPGMRPDQRLERSHVAVPRAARQLGVARWVARLGARVVVVRQVRLRRARHGAALWLYAPVDASSPPVPITLLDRPLPGKVSWSCHAWQVRANPLISTTDVIARLRGSRHGALFSLRPGGRDRRGRLSVDGVRRGSHAGPARRAGAAGDRQDSPPGRREAVRAWRRPVLGRDQPRRRAAVRNR